MALVNGKCPRCNAEIQIEGQSKVGFCMYCGGRVAVSDAVARYKNEHKVVVTEQDIAQQKKTDLANRLSDAQALLTQQSFDSASRIFEELIAGDTDHWEALWGLILAKTHNLTPSVIETPEDFAYMGAIDLFKRGGPSVDQERRDAYWDAFCESCRMTVEAVDPRVFLELEIYKWYAHSNTYLYPVSKDFDIQPILDKVLWDEWKLLADAIPEARRELFTEQCENCCRRIREYFDSGFNNMTEMRNGDLTRLMGTWMRKLSTGAIKTDVFRFSLNKANVAHMEAFRTSLNQYDYYRYIGIDSSNRITAGEHRHFPSATGIGGDFVTFETPEPVFNILAVYEYILILPTALYVRTDLQKIPGIDRAMTYMQKCKSMPCFQRNGLKSAFQMRPIVENDETVEPSKKMRSCYIATAVYGDIDAPEVCRLRRFRDEKLSGSRLGRAFCAFYYKVSPNLSRRIKPNGFAGRAVRRVLDGFVRRLGE